MEIPQPKSSHRQTLVSQCHINSYFIMNLQVYGIQMNTMTSQELLRFNSSIKKSDNGCLLWMGGKDRDGYGIFFFRRKNRRAHRVAYWRDVGDIPKGKMIDHICRNRSCVNSDHLRCVSPRENALIGNGIPAINARKTHCKNGHPFDRKYGKQRYCSICEAAKTKRLRAKWNAADTLQC